MRRLRTMTVACLALATGGLAPAQEDPAGAGRPNVVVIISDDAGYGDFSMHGGKKFPTPRIDSIATNGVRFSNGYVSASVCSPSRAGLLTGRYQQRFGHEFNVPPRFSTENGLPLTEQTMADSMKSLGYRTIALGKWHLGYADHFHPLSRGFESYFGFLQGSRAYWAREGSKLNRLLRDREPIPEKFDYMTDELGRQAAAYMATEDKRPFFMYLCFNAVHTPMHALPADLEKVSGIEKKRRKTLAAMTIALDRAVGIVLDKIDELQIREKTLVFFVNDNGGATNNASSNGQLNGRKGTPYEGGIRVPFVAQWPGTIPAGQVYKKPVSTLDILPTAVATAGGFKEQPKNPLDGVDIMPFITGKTPAKSPHETLFWRQGETSWAIRKGKWKLLMYGGRQAKYKGDAPRLFNLATDRGEKTDLAASEPERVASMKQEWDAWSAQLTKPRWGGPAKRQNQKRQKKQ